jgi:hypothetical protein
LGSSRQPFPSSPYRHFLAGFSSFRQLVHVFKEWLAYTLFRTAAAAKMKTTATTTSIIIVIIIIA